MNRTHILFWIVLLLCAVHCNVNAQATNTQSINVTILPIAELKVSGSSASLIITDVVAGDDPVSVTSSVATYSISTNQSSKKITGLLLEGKAESFTTLSITLQAPSAGGSSLGEVILTAQPADLVVGIPAGAHQNRSITFKFSTTVEAGVIPSTSRTVVLTLTDNI
ncbi:MAG: hypothetical protein AB9903_31545 [Vulcanimicrobiota bacterium]